ncbi:mitochondrial putative sulfite oxidase [Rhizodiscina lignyota]|uniref:Mitochondrial putative sulfite oxidase n=1 Tax=Rhizodiscina lignyota TaxID=1504668 RepID=A0A9P4ILT4_9PEZI|nr:mitochondrial putative sulfite oxidase [Rhizodiscina lignyota]
MNPPEFQLSPPPDTNPIFGGERWKKVHQALGEPLAELPSKSWEVVEAEKAKDMRHVLEFPYNGEPPPEKLHENLITPNQYHFVRNHGGIPTIDSSQCTLIVDGLVNKPSEMGLSVLQDGDIFRQQSLIATIQCSGNRRSELLTQYPAEGDDMINAPWEQRAISTAKWTGVSLRDVIDYCGGFAAGGRHVELIGADTYIKGNTPLNYAVSVPWAKINADQVLLAWEMNGRPLPRIHGGPLRAVVLGSIGARSTKWLYRIRVLDQPSMSPVQRVEYLFFNHQVSKANGDFKNGMPILEMPVSSAILSPRSKDVIIHEGTIHVRGWAYSGGGRWPEIVEVSTDDGYSWNTVPDENLTPKHMFALRLWEIKIPVSIEGWIDLKCRTFDNALNTQPSSAREVWNWSAHVTHCQHRVSVFSIDKRNSNTAKQLENIKAQGKGLVPVTLPARFRDAETGSRWHEPPELQPRSAKDDHT